MSFYTNVQKYGNRILYVGYENGKRIVDKIEYYPKLFVSTNKKSNYQSIFGEYVDTITPGNMNDCKEFVENHSNVSNFKIYGTQDYAAQYISDTFPNGCELDIDKINVSYIDIECKSDNGFPKPDVAEQPITAITLKSNQSDTFYTWGCGDYNAPDNVEYVNCRDENTLLHLFLDHWSKNCPDIITGWNVKYFDMCYIVNRINRILGEKETKRLSPFKIAPWIKRAKGGEQFAQIIGVNTMDYLDLFKKFGYSYGPQESYSLDNISNVVLGEKKLDYSEYESLHDLYIQDHQKFIDYNVRDTALVERIDETTGLIALAITLAYKANTQFENVFGSVKIWEVYIYNTMIRDNLVAPIADKSNSSGHKIEGGYVKEPKIGMNRWVASFDANSLYPHLIMQYNLSPETIIKSVGGHTVDNLLNGQKIDIPENCNITPGGLIASNTKKGLFPHIVDSLYSERADIKKEMLRTEQAYENTKGADKTTQKLLLKTKNKLHNEQMAIKILMNSLYGAMANQYFQFFDNRIAEAITLSGQLTIRWAERAVNSYLQKIMGDKKDRVVAIDTDSVYVSFIDIVKKYEKNANDIETSKFIDDMATQAIEPMFEKSFDSLAKYLNAYEQKIIMGREVIASKMIITGKKRYITHVINSEGVQFTKPKLKITGIESVRSSTPMICRKYIEDTLHIIMNDDEKTLHNFVSSKRKEFNNQLPEDVAFPRGVSEVKKYTNGKGYNKGTPIAVRSAILFNNLMRENKNVEPIKDGDKIKFLYLKTPNKIGENVIGFPKVFPKQLNFLKPHIDFDMQFEKSYLNPMRTICNAIGWSTEKKSSLEDFFS